MYRKHLAALCLMRTLVSLSFSQKVAPISQARYPAEYMPWELTSWHCLGTYSGSKGWRIQLMEAADRFHESKHREKGHLSCVAAN